ncbi:MAG TPA: Crp/Fnr family transcriptional regulator [Solirubrobacteraceae bacterium]|jgi:CRP-like cAMP-binding protein|nr:Crp/Fnr family transcriptional regulator [Solirubrobacteraceae bacterium]
MRSLHPLPAVSLLEHDPDMAGSVPADRLDSARRHLVSRTSAVRVGEWTAGERDVGPGGGAGLLILEGVTVRRTRIGPRRTAELLGQGDLLRPWQDGGGSAHYPTQGSLQALEPLRLAHLDLEFLSRASAYPEILACLTARALERARALSIALAVAQIPSLQERLLVTLWHLADRYGRVRPDGVLVPLKLTHELLAELSAAQRPSVTTALGALRGRALITPEGRGWLLRGDPPTLHVRHTASVNGGS